MRITREQLKNFGAISNKLKRIRYQYFHRSVLKLKSSVLCIFYYNLLVTGVGKKETKNADKMGLRREMGLFSAINMILSVMIGSGIFVSPAPVLLYSGSVGMCIVIWAICGIVSLLGE